MYVYGMWLSKRDRASLIAKLSAFASSVVWSLEWEFEWDYLCALRLLFFFSALRVHTTFSAGYSPFLPIYLNLIKKQRESKEKRNEVHAAVRRLQRVHQPTSRIYTAPSVLFIAAFAAAAEGETHTAAPHELSHSQKHCRSLLLLFILPFVHTTSSTRDKNGSHILHSSPSYPVQTR